jgi:ERCC4-related helicase
MKRKKIVENFNDGVYDALLISSAGAEGLDLKKTTSVHILEPHWNNEKIEQVIGRAVRYDSHKGLSKEKQVVEVYQYYAKKPIEQMSVKTPKSLKITNRMPEKVRNMLMKHDMKAFDKHYLESMMSEPVVVPTLDIYLKNMSKIKKHINKEFLERVRDVSIEKQECGSSNEKLSFK